MRGDFNPKIFHQKFILRDYYDGKATNPGNPALLSGSANFTVTDTHVNLNHVFVFHSAYVSRQYELEFLQLRHGMFGRGLHGDVPATYDLGGVPVKVLFAPDHTPELELMKQMLKGQTETLFAIFTFAGSSGHRRHDARAGPWRDEDPRRPRPRPGGPRLGGLEDDDPPQHRPVRPEEGPASSRTCASCTTS